MIPVSITVFQITVFIFPAFAGFAYRDVVLQKVFISLLFNYFILFLCDPHR
jgi:hypothetical protein